MANKATSAPAATQAAGPQEPKAPGLFEIGELRKFQSTLPVRGATAKQHKGTGMFCDKCAIS